MEITNTDYLLYEANCVNCKKSDGGEERLNLVEFGWHNDTILCDECLQELNRKIVERLAEKHL